MELPAATRALGIRFPQQPDGRIVGAPTRPSQDSLQSTAAADGPKISPWCRSRAWLLPWTVVDFVARNASVVLIRPGSPCRSGARPTSTTGESSARAAPALPPPRAAWPNGPATWTRAAAGRSCAARPPRNPHPRRAAPPAGGAPRRPGDQPAGKQPRRLHGHADAFRHGRMGLAGTVAHEKQAAVGADANSWSNGPGRQPRPEPGCAGECPADAHASVLEVLQHGFAPRTAAADPQGRKTVAADAAREADAGAVAVDHAAVAARKDQQRHQPRRQVAVREMGLEAE